MAAITRLGAYGGTRGKYGDFSGKVITINVVPEIEYSAKVTQNTTHNAIVAKDTEYNAKIDGAAV